MKTLAQLRKLDREYARAGISKNDIRRLFLRSNKAWMRYTLAGGAE